MSALLCSLNRSMQYLISNCREEDVANEVRNEELLRGSIQDIDVRLLAERRIAQFYWWLFWPQSFIDTDHILSDRRYPPAFDFPDTTRSHYIDSVSGDSSARIH
jgi:hypothetical protein